MRFFSKKLLQHSRRGDILLSYLVKGVVRFATHSGPKARGVFGSGLGQGPTRVLGPTASDLSEWLGRHS
jgi:hypothetical protein